MSLADVNIIDFVVRRPGSSSHVALIAADTGEIVDDTERERALLNKLTAYFMFVVSGQFVENYPDFANCELSIEVVCSTPPTAEMKKIEGISDPSSPNIVLPVSVVEERGFRVKFGLRTTSG